MLGLGGSSEGEELRARLFEAPVEFGAVRRDLDGGLEISAAATKRIRLSDEWSNQDSSLWSIYVLTYVGSQGDKGRTHCKLAFVVWRGLGHGARFPKIIN